MPTDPTPLTQRMRTLGSLLRTAYTTLADQLYGRLAEEGYEDIRPAHSAVLRNLPEEGARLTTLAAQADMTKQSMAYLVGYLEEQGYVTVKPDPEDGRARVVRLTARGRRLMDTMLALSADIETRVAQKLGKARLEEFRRTLTDIDQAMR
jgi:DNA-binding MarR family transcriptional regulator